MTSASEEYIFQSGRKRGRIEVICGSMYEPLCRSCYIEATKEKKEK